MEKRAEVPSIDNGGLTPDGLSVTWKLKQGVQWQDGEPFAAEDCVFNWEYARNPETATVTAGVASKSSSAKTQRELIWKSQPLLRLSWS
jgi:ABC-type transport system substrate-binding protein